MKKILTIGLLWVAVLGVRAQEIPADTLFATQHMEIRELDTLIEVGQGTQLRSDSVRTIYYSNLNWKPNPARAVWLGAIFPGLGQIYNRSYWKLPIVYGGLMGCIYAITWNNNMYRDYKQAYRLW